MQFHLNGFKGADDPLKLQFEGDQEPDFQTSLPSELDVLIVGAGPAGLLLATQLAQFSNITTRLIDGKTGPLQQGQADGLQCRTVEIFEAFGFADRVLKEAYWVNETTFWSPGEDGTGLRRTGRIRDTEEGLSEFPHVILNQARLHGLWLDAMKWSPTRLEPSYDRKLIDLTVADELVNVVVERGDGRQEHVQAKYVVGCDGARSVVRNKIGLEMKGDFANQAWGVMDVLVVTDFPDLRLKTNIHSASEGSVIIIPREGGYLVRLYIEMDKLSPGERVADKDITLDVIIDRAQRIFRPFTLDVKHVAYWSVYEVGQRLTNHFDNEPSQQRYPRVFIAGDACHTHSAKAGQGMNVSMNDTFNLGWKLASVLRGQAHPRLLCTYSAERQRLAQQLIDFDHKIAKLTASKRKADATDAEDTDPAVFQKYFTQQGRFMAGLTTAYGQSIIVSVFDRYQHLATGYKIGERFQSSQVVRFADAKPIQLAHEMKADGRWRIVLFSGEEHPLHPQASMMQLCDILFKEVIPRYQDGNAEIDSVFDVRAVFQQCRRDLDIKDLPEILLPHKGIFGIQDYEKVFTDEPSYNFGHGDIYRVRGIDKQHGAMVVVRPDQYVSTVLPLDSEGATGLMHFLDEFMVVRSSCVGGP